MHTPKVYKPKNTGFPHDNWFLLQSFFCTLCAAVGDPVVALWQGLESKYWIRELQNCHYFFSKAAGIRILFEHRVLYLPNPGWISAKVPHGNALTFGHLVMGRA